MKFQTKHFSYNYSHEGCLLTFSFSACLAFKRR